MATDNRIQTLINEQTDEATGLVLNDPENGGLSLFSWMVRTGETVPAWWSRARDGRLSSIWKESSHLSTAIYNTQAKMVGIPPRITARDASNDEHIAQAEQLTYLMNVSAGFGEGWIPTYARFIEDYITQDNGGMFEIIGDGPADGAIVGLPLGVRHLDSSRCTRSGHPIYPILYTGDDGKLYKLHWTRVIYMSQMPSARKEMNGVGFCGVSRCIEVAQTLMDMVRYKQERLGSRPHNQILIGKGITGATIMGALVRMDDQLSNMGFTRYAKTIALGSENPDVSLEKIDLTHMEPFDEEISTNLGMFVIAAALGMDADEVWPTSGRSGGGSQGDADLRRMRSRGRLPAQLTSELATQFNLKVLPPHLQLEFDFKDDEQDQQQALVRDIRGRNRERDLTSGSINIRAARKQMLIDEDVDQPTFNEMELEDGRLPDGTTIGMLFFDEDPVYTRLLRFLPSPLQFTTNIMGEMGTDEKKFNDILGKIQAQREVVLTELANTSSGKKLDRIRRSYHALDWLEERYVTAAGRGLPEVPTVSRRLRTDIRVAPEEVSPQPGETSPAQQASGGDTSNVENMTAND